MKPIDQQYLDDMKRQEIQRQIDKKSDDFGTIEISKKEFKLLQKSKNKLVIVTSKNQKYAFRLQELDFIRILRFSKPGKESVDVCDIRTRGENYLYYKKAHMAEKRSEYLHDWKLQIFSAIAGALLSRPLWDGIDWAVSLLRVLLTQK